MVLLGSAILSGLSFGCCWANTWLVVNNQPSARALNILVQSRIGADLSSTASVFPIIIYDSTGSLGLRTKLFRSYRGNRSISNSSSITASVLPIPRALKNHIFAPPWVTPSARRLFGQAPALTLRHRESACRQVPNLCG